MEPLNKEFVVMVNDIFKTPLSSHIYRGYTILPAPVNPINAVEVCTNICINLNLKLMFAFKLVSL